MVLITGATGLVGSHLALHLLEHGESVGAIYRSPLSTDFTKAVFKLYGKEMLYEQIRWLQADINDIPSLETAFDGITEVYHCAALISFNRNDEEQLRKVNIEGTANIVNLCLAHNVAKLCFVSSVAALGDLKPHEEIVTEETEWNPEKHHSDYAITKYGAEMEIWRGQQEGLETVVVNPGVILGPSIKGFNRGSGEIFTAIENELPFFTKGTTGFIAVSDVVKIMRLLMKSDISGERFTLVESNYDFEDIGNTIADALGVKRPWIHAKPWMISLAWRTDWLIEKIIGKKRLLYRDIAKSLHATEQFSNRKIKDLLDYEFQDSKQYIVEIASRLKKNVI